MGRLLTFAVVSRVLRRGERGKGREGEGREGEGREGEGRERVGEGEGGRGGEGRGRVRERGGEEERERKTEKIGDKNKSEDYRDEVVRGCQHQMLTSSI